jgi:hypothetical protein
VAPTVSSLAIAHNWCRHYCTDCTFVMLFYSSTGVVKQWKLSNRYVVQLLRTARSLPAHVVASMQHYSWVQWPLSASLCDVELLAWLPGTFFVSALEQYKHRRERAKMQSALLVSPHWIGYRG